MGERQWQFIGDQFVDVWNGNQTADDWDAYVKEESSPHHRMAFASELMLELCGCGNPELIADAMYDYLCRARKQFDHSQLFSRAVRDDENELADLLLAYMADRLGFTEHGGSVMAAWLTAAGEEYIALVERERG